MATVKVIYKLNETGRRASLLAGGNGKRVQEVEVPATPELLALAKVDSDGNARIVACADAGAGPGTGAGIAVYYTADGGQVKKHSVSSWDDTDALDAPPADLSAYVLGIPAANSARRALAETEAQKQQEAAAATRAAELVNDKPLFEAWLTDPKRGGYSRGPGERNLYSGNTSGTVTTLALSEEDCARFDVELARRQAVWQEREQRECTERLVAKEKAKAARAEWVRAHGSPRLKKGLDAGLLDKMANVYRDERMQMELGEGWIAWESAIEPSNSERINPSEAELDALAGARAKWPDCEVELVTVGGRDKHGDEHKWRPALWMLLPWVREDTAIRYLDEVASRCPLCGERHAPGSGTPGFSCETE